VDSRDQTSWFELMPPDGPGPTVVAVPYAGGSGRAFRSLRRHVPADCGLALVDLPGHGRQVNGTCLRDADQAATGLLEALDALPATGFVLLGHSLGGVLAYEVAARLTERGAPPAGLVVCGSRAPFTGLGHPPVAHMPSGEPFLRAAVDLGLAAPEMLELPDLAEAFGGMLQADMAMTASYQHRRRPPLPVPACVVGFSADWIVPEPALRAWDELFDRPPLHLRMAGGHLALHERANDYGETVRTAVEHVLAREASDARGGGHP
jgi:surfactin synthase thioesterase subunit